ncbi:Unknown protein sequence [Pseudomonas syringae pv. cilantro]|uniref:Uncharacterized protein n=4 Tax=Pseudomonas syringae group TaxID=136849 RepID=A0A3M3R852_PSECA|nr:Unknown protein sequence [Pseudomonas syringae pv. maculicola]KPC26494.1 Unknown protein sequence [Pseudomonas syringae pv. cilantro]KPW17221.1 hypothetical protein ALO83_104210 [Pseudomonas cannabina pv. alisalensis]KPW73128.1 hypothetical protein ALO76_102579 [Pseudomonas syringae pv. coriandricola]RMN80156.1 hypothetical protein ALQ53_103926 [Pseudomonas cannabina]RMO80528.1 hypothetical protein ALQ33_102271 [Pseudomonas syringae pv. philadelphi]
MRHGTAFLMSGIACVQSDSAMQTRVREPFVQWYRRCVK